MDEAAAIAVWVDACPRPGWGVNEASALAEADGEWLPIGCHKLLPLGERALPREREHGLGVRVPEFSPKASLEVLSAQRSEISLQLGVDGGGLFERLRGGSGVAVADEFAVRGLDDERERLDERRAGGAEAGKGEPYPVVRS